MSDGSALPCTPTVSQLLSTQTLVISPATSPGFPQGIMIIICNIITIITIIITNIITAKDNSHNHENRMLKHQRSQLWRQSKRDMAH